MAILAVALPIIGLLSGGFLIRMGIRLAAPRLLGVPVSVEHVTFKPFQGHATITELTIGNPEGFSTNDLLRVKHLQVDLATRSLFSRTIRVHQILVASPCIHYEWIGRRSNIGMLVDRLESAPDEEDDTPDPPPKSVIIEELRISAPVFRIQSRSIGRTPLTLTPGDIVLTNLGGPDQSTAQIIARILNAIATTAINAGGSASQALDDGVRTAAGGITQVGKKTADAVSSGVKSVARGVGRLFRRSRKNDQQDDDPD